MDIKGKTKQGVVKSDKMEKTIVVVVDTRKRHPLYKKTYVSSKTYKVHDENKTAKVGDVVRIIPCRHYSKDKCWRLLEILERDEISAETVG